LVVLGYFNPGVRFRWLLRQKLEDVVVDNNFIELDVFPAKRTIGLAFKTGHTFLANGVVHCADDHRLLVAAIVVVEADVTLVDVGESFVN